MTDVVSGGDSAAVGVVGKIAPAAKREPITGNLRAMQRDPLTFLLGLQRRFGDVSRFFFFSQPDYFISSPAGVKRVLQENNRNYSKNHYSYGVLKHALGNGLLTNDGESWLSQRRLMQPAFHRQRIAGFGETMTRLTEEMLDKRWQGAAAQGKVIDVAAEMHRLTLRIAGMTLFSEDLTSASSEMGPSIVVAQRRLTEQFFQPFLPMWLPTPGHREFGSAMAVQDKVVYDLIAERRADGRDRGDLLSMLLQARDADTGKGMDDKQLRDEVITLMDAGHETTANAMTWIWYLLSQHPLVGRKLRDELAHVLAGRTPTAQDLSNLPYTRLVVDEALRLYPPAWVISRLAENEDEICGYTIPAKSVVLVSPYTMHRNPRYWDNPEGFDPERFSKERAEGRPPYAYFPFGGGPRLCIGNSFALTEAALLLATIAQRFRLDLVPGHPVVAEPLITLRAKYGIKVTLYPVD